MFLAYFWRLKRFAFQRAKGKVAIEVIIYRDQSRPKLQKNKCLKIFFISLDEFTRSLILSPGC